MEARDFLGVVRRRWLAIVAVVVICTGAVAALQYKATPQYRASAKVYFAIKSGGTVNALSLGSAYVQAQVLTYATLATTPTVITPVIADLKLDRTTNQVAGEISASVLPNTVIVTIEATDPSPRLAASLANSVAQQLGVTVAALAPVDANGASTIAPRTIATAQVPKNPVSPKKKRNIAATFVGSLLLGIALAMLLELVVTQVRRDRSALPLIDAPMLGEVPLLADVGVPFARVQSGLYQAGADFDRLRESLDFVLVDRLPKVVIVAGTTGQEDKSATALRLAFASAEAGTRTLLIDANLRIPTVAMRLGKPRGPGLSSVLAGRTSFDDVVTDFGTQLDVLTSGPTPPNPSYLLGSKTMESLLKELSGRYGLVIIDSSAVLTHEDTKGIVPYVAGVVLVAPARRRRFGQRSDANKQLDWSSVREAAKELGPVSALLGIVAAGR